MSSEPKRSEKEEKGDADWGSEKWSGEKWSSDPLGRITWALIIIWAGAVFLLRNLGGDEKPFLGMDSDNVWAWIMAGAGVILWLEVLLRLATPAYRRPMSGRFILGTILVVIGVGGVIDVSLWPLIIVAIGISMLLGYFARPSDF